MTCQKMSPLTAATNVFGNGYSIPPRNFLGRGPVGAGNCSPEGKEAAQRRRSGRKLLFWMLTSSTLAARFTKFASGNKGVVDSQISDDICCLAYAPAFLQACQSLSVASIMSALAFDNQADGCFFK